MKLNVTQEEKEALQDFVDISRLGPMIDRISLARGISAVVGTAVFQEMVAHAHEPGIGIKLAVVETVEERLTEKDEVWRPRG